MKSVSRILGILALVLLLPGRAPAQVSVVDRTLQQRSAAPGEMYSGSIAVTNTADEPRDARIYQTDYLFHADGRNEFGSPGSAPRTNAPWITFTQSVITIPPRSQTVVQYTVSVPAAHNQKLSGSYWSVLMVEPIASGAESLKAAQGEAGVGVVTRLRYGVQIVTHIDGTGEVRLDIANPRIQLESDGGQFLAFDITNIGERSTPLDVRLELYDSTGGRVKNGEAGERIIHPGTSVRKRFDLGSLPAGAYQALITADTGVDIFGAQYTIRF